MQTLLAGIYTISNLTNLSGYIYVTALVDIGIIATLIYTAIILFRRARSYVVLFGIALLALLYGAAILLELFLTTLVLQAFFAVILIIIVVLFQEEMRRFFERVATIGTRLQRVAQPKQKQVLSGGIVEEITRAVAQLAREKVGALLIFPGEENVERHMQGGQMLDAVISEDLLRSLFDPDSPGHDGAVLIDQQRVARFGLHLPLSNQMDRVAKMGTRHTAAIGLSERCDALVLVVSEERGVISIAQHGNMREVEADTLADILRDFLKQREVHDAKVAKSFLVRNVPEKLFSLGIAITMWGLVAFPAGTVQRDFTVPVSYQNLTDEVVIVETDPVEITIALSGRGRAPFDSIRAESIQLILDGSNFMDGINIVPLEESMVKRPTNISVVNMHPNTIEVTASLVVRVDVPLEPVVEGVPQEGYELEGVRVTPKTLSLLIPINTKVPTSIPTQVVSLDGLSKNRTETVLVAPPAKTRLALPEQARVTVTVQIRKKESGEE